MFDQMLPRFGIGISGGIVFRTDMVVEILINRVARWSSGT